MSELFYDLPSLNDGDGSIYSINYLPYHGSYLYDSQIRSNLNFTTQHIARPHSKQDKEIYKIAVEKWELERKRLNYRDLPDYLQTHKNKNSHTDRFKIIAPDIEYAQTIVAHICKDGHYYIHPDKDQNRSISPRKRQQEFVSFPDS